MAIGDVLVVGNGGREHAIIWKLAQSPHVKKIYTAPGNEGTKENAENIPIKVHDISALCQFALEKDIDLTIVSPELPLELGIADLFHQHNLDIFGPTAVAARVETSKLYAKNLMFQKGILTASFRAFRNYPWALRYVYEKQYPLVIKADGLAGGKASYVCKSVDQAKTALSELMLERIHGKAGDVVIIEDFLEGEEISIHALCNGQNSASLITARDAKRLEDGDKGPNTGGMGAYAPVSRFTNEQLFHVEQSIINPVLHALVKRETPFMGCLYPGLMIVNDVPYVLEFNARFGDPETQVLMMLIQSDLFLLLKSWIHNEPVLPVFMDNIYAVCVVICSKEYPLPINNPVPIHGIKRAHRLSDDIMIFHAATTSIGGMLHTNGGRVLGVTAKGATLDVARDLAYQACDLIDLDGQYRKDIARIS